MGGPDPLTVAKAVEGKPIPWEEGPFLRQGETLHLRVRLHRFLDGAVLPVQPVPAPHAAIQTRVNLERRVSPGNQTRGEGYVPGATRPAG
jgi:hypothetical protein